MNEESVVDPLEFRKEILHLMERAPRYSTVSIGDGTGGDSNDLVIDMIVTVVRHYMEADLVMKRPHGGRVIWA